MEDTRVKLVQLLFIIVSDSVDPLIEHPLEDQATGDLFQLI